MKHAESLMERILFLDGTPSMEPLALSIGKNVKGMIETDLKLELGAVVLYNEAARIAADEKTIAPRFVYQAAQGRGRARGLARSPVAPDCGAWLRALSDHADQRSRVAAISCTFSCAA